MSYNAHDLSNRLLNALDNNYNVVDMQAVNEIISILEKFNITKELLETTRLGKHVNELRRKTSDPTLARRAKVLVKRWRDLVIPTVASPGHTGKNGSNRSSAERQVRRLGGTPLTSPALSRMVSPAVNSPRPPSRPAWGGYESDSQDVILVDDDPPPPPPLAAPPPPLPPNALKPLTPPVKRPTSPVASHDDKKAKRDKKPKKRRGHSRAGSGTETTTAAPHVPPPADAAPAPAPAPAGAAPVPAGAPGAAGAGAWGARNGSERRRNGYRREKVDPYAALVNRMPAVGAKKVKTTKELLEEIQSRGSKATTSPSSPASPASPDVMLVEPDSHLIKVDSPLRNGGSPPPPVSPKPPPSPYVPLEDEREYFECECGEEEDGNCPAKSKTEVRVEHVTALHHALLPGVNGTRAPLFPHKFAVRPAADPDRSGLFSSVVPLYKYSDYADDYCAKNMSSVPLCAHLEGQFAPPPPSPPRPPSPPEPRPYPIDPDPDPDVPTEPPPSPESPALLKCPLDPIVPSEVGVPPLEPSERLKPPILSADDERAFPSEASEAGGASGALEVKKEFASELCEHRTVERTKAPPVEDPRSPEPLNGRLLYSQCAHARASIPYDYSQLCAAPELPASASASALGSAFAAASASTTRDELGRPSRPARFAEWHECARLGDLIALPYVVID